MVDAAAWASRLNSTAAQDRIDAPYESHAQRIAGAHVAGAEKGREQEVSVFLRSGASMQSRSAVVKADNKLRVLEHGKFVAEIPNPALTDEAPVYKTADGAVELQFERDAGAREARGRPRTLRT